MNNIKHREIPIYKGKGPFNWCTELIENSFTFSTRKDRLAEETYVVKLPINNKLIISSNADFIQHVLNGNAKNYEKSKNYDYAKLFLGEGLFTSRGEKWRKQRKIIQPVFKRKHLSCLFDVMVKATDEHLSKLKQRLQENPNVEMSEEMMAITAELAMKTLFSSANVQERKQMYESNSYFQEYVMTRIFKPYKTPLLYLNGEQSKFDRLKRNLDKMLKKLIEERRLTINRPDDLLTMLIESKDEETGEKMSFQQILDEAATMYFAGHETSANSLFWIFYLLSQHTEVLQKLKAEIEQHDLQKLTPLMMQKMTYSTMVIKEAMRLYPAAHVLSRTSIEEDVNNEFYIPKESMINLNIAGLHRHPRYWENPNEFKPERFSKENSKSISNKQYMPFGGGSRMCVGNHFAMMEIQLVLIFFIKQFKFQILSNQQIITKPEITLKSKNGMKMQLAPN